MNGWFIAILILYTLSLGMVLGKDGQQKEGKHNFWVTLFSSAISLTLIYLAIRTGF